MTFNCHSTTWIVALPTWKKVAFSVGQEAENYFKMPFHNLNHSIFDFIEFVFWATKEAVRIALQPLEKSLFLIHPSHILGCFFSRKYVASDMLVFETSVSPPQTSRNFEWSRCRKWVQSYMRALETSLSRIHPCRILGVFKRKKMSSQYMATTLIIVFSTSRKSNFMLVKRQKMTFKFH